MYEIDAVRDALRAAVAEERVLLLEDIEFLTALLTEETDLQVRRLGCFNRCWH